MVGMTETVMNEIHAKCLTILLVKTLKIFLINQIAERCIGVT